MAGDHRTLGTTTKPPRTHPTFKEIGFSTLTKKKQRHRASEGGHNKHPTFKVICCPFMKRTGGGAEGVRLSCQVVMQLPVASKPGSIKIKPSLPLKSQAGCW